MNEIPSSLSTFYILIVLLPGFVTLFVERSLAYQRQDQGVVIIAKALLYAFVNYTVFSLSGRPLATFSVTTAEKGIQNLSITPDWKGALGLFACSVLLGIVVGFLRTSDLHMIVARAIKLTKRSARNSIWLDIFHDKYRRKSRLVELFNRCLMKLNLKKQKKTYGSHVIVYLKDGRSIYGWPEYYADDFTGGPTIFLTSAEWLQDDRTKNIEIPYPGILIMGSNIDYIQFYMKEGESTHE